MTTPRWQYKKLLELEDRTTVLEEGSGVQVAQGRAITRRQLNKRIALLTARVVVLETPPPP